MPLLRVSRGRLWNRAPVHVWWQHFTAFEWCLTCLWCMFAEIDVGYHRCVFDVFVAHVC